MSKNDLGLQTFKYCPGSHSQSVGCSVSIMSSCSLLAFPLLVRLVLLPLLLGRLLIVTTPCSTKLASYPGLLTPAFVACSTNAGEGLVKLSHVV